MKTLLHTSIEWLVRIGWTAPLIATALASPLPSESSSRPAITVEQVAGALAARGLTVQADRITLPMRVTSASGDPQLEVASIEQSGDHLARVRLACHDHADCLPFYVSVPWQAPASAAAAEPGPTPQKSVGGNNAVHVGSHATLTIDDQHLHIRVQVICLEAGEQGRIVRAASLDHKQTYQAEVIRAGLLKGSL